MTSVCNTRKKIPQDRTSHYCRLENYETAVLTLFVFSSDAELDFRLGILTYCHSGLLVLFGSVNFCHFTKAIPPFSQESGSSSNYQGHSRVRWEPISFLCISKPLVQSEDCRLACDMSCSVTLLNTDKWPHSQDSWAIVSAGVFSSDQAHLGNLCPSHARHVFLRRTQLQSTFSQAFCSRIITPSSVTYKTYLRKYF